MQQNQEGFKKELRQIAFSIAIIYNIKYFPIRIINNIVEAAAKCPKEQPHNSLLIFILLRCNDGTQTILSSNVE